MEELVRATANFATRLENDDATTITIYVWRVRLNVHRYLFPRAERMRAHPGTRERDGFLRWPPRTRRKGMEKEEEEGEERRCLFTSPIFTRVHTQERVSTYGPLFTG